MRRICYLHQAAECRTAKKIFHTAPVDVELLPYSRPEAAMKQWTKVRDTYQQCPSDTVPATAMVLWCQKLESFARHARTTETSVDTEARASGLSTHIAQRGLPP